MSENKMLKDFVEKGADIEHDRWARWQKYLHSLCIKNKDGSLTIPKERVEWWESEIATPYKNLKEELKEYDRKETRNYLPLVKEIIKKIIEIIDNKARGYSDLKTNAGDENYGALRSLIDELEIKE